MAEFQLLSGVRVIDWCYFQTAPYASQMLAGLGADVIHVEPRGQGDLLRGVERSLGVEYALPGGRHALFEEFNLNKRGLTLNIKKPKGMEILHQLIAKSDVFLTNFRQKAIDRLGMSYVDLREHNPQLIYCSISGFGGRGPAADIPSLDMFAQARSGAMTTGRDDDEPPALGIANIGDRIASITAAFGIMAALNCRFLHGIGQELQLSQLGSLMCMQGANITPVLLVGKPPEKVGPDRPSAATYTWYKCKDGRWLAAGGTGEKYWV
ncbi:MAG: CoA transferase, partial [Dehalococcoidia bacterium]|nr:CoA transferase [Dehalococcoidia bacterium]